MQAQKTRSGSRANNEHERELAIIAAEKKVTTTATKSKVNELVIGKYIGYGRHIRNCGYSKS